MEVSGVRSSCETVATKSDFICSTTRSLETSRKAKMRPATSPPGSSMSASVRESQTSLSPRWIEIARSRGRRFPSPASSRWSTSGTRRPSASDAGTPVICSAMAFHSTIIPSRSTATMPSAMLARIASLRSFSSATRW
jgi:hypothetical protein